MKKLLPIFLISALFAPTVLAGEPQIEAKAAFVYDIKSGKVLYAHNQSAQLPLASLTKLMTVYSAAEFGSGLLERDEACFTLVVSSNNEATKIAERIPSATMEMNLNAKALGMTQTFYLNPTGLDISEHLAGAYGSAKDMARLVEEMYYELPEILDCTREKEARLGDLLLSNTNPDVSKIIGLIGTKTGLTDLAGGNLAIIFDSEIDQPVIVIVLGSSEKGRFSDVEALINYAMEIKSGS